MKRPAFSDSFYEVIGAFIGDGFMSVWGNHCRLGFSANQEDELGYYTDVIIPAIKKVFPEEQATICTNRKGKSVEIRYHSRDMIECFRNWFGFEPGPKTETIQIPQWIVNGPRELLLKVIRGIFDTDGCIFFDDRNVYAQPYPRINFCMKNGVLMEQIAQALSPQFTFYRQHHVKRGAYYLEIYGHKNLQEWFKTIGFSNPRHLSKLHASVAQR